MENGRIFHYYSSILWGVDCPSLHQQPVRNDTPINPWKNGIRVLQPGPNGYSRIEEFRFLWAAQIWWFLKLGDPQVTIMFNTKPWLSGNLQIWILHYESPVMNHHWIIIMILFSFFQLKIIWITSKSSCFCSTSSGHRGRAWHSDPGLGSEGSQVLRWSSQSHATLGDMELIIPSTSY